MFSSSEGGVSFQSEPTKADLTKNYPEVIGPRPSREIVLRNPKLNLYRSFRNEGSVWQKREIALNPKPLNRSSLNQNPKPVEGYERATPVFGATRIHAGQSNGFTPNCGV